MSAIPLELFGFAVGQRRSIRWVYFVRSLTARRAYDRFTTETGRSTFGDGSLESNDRLGAR